VIELGFRMISCISEKSKLARADGLSEPLRSFSNEPLVGSLFSTRYRFCSEESMSVSISASMALVGPSSSVFFLNNFVASCRALIFPGSK